MNHSNDANYLLFFSKARDLTARYLSNFTEAPVEYNGVVFPSIENAFQAAKFLHSTKPHLFAELASMTPAEAKSAGSRTGMKKRGATLDLATWDKVSLTLMKQLVEQRMKTDARYKEIIEQGRRDGVAFLHFERSGAKSLWGGSFPKDFPKAPAYFHGANRLGRILSGHL